MMHEAIQETVFVVGVFSGVPLVLAAIAGLFVSVIQAATQIQEQSISYVVKVLTVAGCLLVGGSLALSYLVLYLQRMLASIVHLGNS